MISHHLGHDVRKTPYDTFVLQMLDREKEMTGPIRLFVLEKNLHYAPGFYLKTLEAKKDSGFTVQFTPSELERLSKKAVAFEVRRDSTIDEARGAHFWAVTSTYSWTEKVTPQEIMTQRGCQVGPDLRSSDRYHTITAFPVWCDAAPLKESHRRLAAGVRHRNAGPAGVRANRTKPCVPVRWTC